MSRADNASSLRATSDLTTELRRVAAALRQPFPSGFVPTQDKAAAELLERAARAIAQQQDAAARARSWKQRAKSAEGHLLASDLEASARNLHAFSSEKDTPWGELGFEVRAQLYLYAARALTVVDHRRRQRSGRTMSLDAAMQEMVATSQHECPRCRGESGGAPGGNLSERLEALIALRTDAPLHASADAEAAWLREAADLARRMEQAPKATISEYGGDVLAASSNLKAGTRVALVEVPNA